ncbi:MAG: hypothetical protein AB7G06_07065 [Bdellovibrionales bacterium]
MNNISSALTPDIDNRNAAAIGGWINFGWSLFGVTAGTTAILENFDIGKSVATLVQENTGSLYEPTGLYLFAKITDAVIGNVAKPTELKIATMNMPRSILVGFLPGEKILSRFIDRFRKNADKLYRCNEKDPVVRFTNGKGVLNRIVYALMRSNMPFCPR